MPGGYIDVAKQSLAPIRRILIGSAQEPGLARRRTAGRVNEIVSERVEGGSVQDGV